MQLNPHYAELNESYLFSTIAHKVADYQKAHPDADIIRLGIGDVTLPLAASVTEAMHRAVEEQGHKDTFHGYIPSEQGYEFLRDAIRRYYTDHGVALDMSEIFVSDGAKSDLGNLLDLFSQDNTILVPDPVYPVYVDDNVMAGRKILYLPATAENHFLPMPDEAPHADIVYICSPNNPTGATYSVEQLKAWVAWAKANDAVILFDAAYECFVTEKGLARSIFEVEGAKEVAIEVCSFSKIAGFTGTRCGYTIVPQALAEQDVAAPPDHQIQRRCLCCAARCRGRLYRGGHAGDPAESGLLPHQRRRHRVRAGRGRHLVLRRQEQPLPLAALPQRDGQLGVL